MSNYAKYYNINKNRSNPNKCLLRLPQANTMRYGWDNDYPSILYSFLVEGWFCSTDITYSNFFFKYVDSLIKNEKFDFDEFSYVGRDEQSHYPFREIKEEHNACTVNIYAERIYTNFSSYVVNNQGQHVSILATLLNHPEYVRSLNYKKSGNTSYRLSYLPPSMSSGFKKFAEATLANESLSEENKDKIMNGFNTLVDHVSSQSIYSEDELVTSHRDRSYISILFSLYLEYFIFMGDEKHIYQLFEVYHKVGNVKAKTFNKYLKNNDEITNFAERPIAKFIPFNLGGSNAPLDEYYYYVSFYKKYDGGKFLNKIVSDSLIQSYIMAFKMIAAKKIPVKKEYYTLFNEIKDKEVYDLEVFEQMNNLVAAQPTGTAALDILEQNFSLLELCLNNDVYGSRWNNDIYNLFTRIDYENALNEQQQSRYWKMVANFVNNTKFKGTKIKKILSDVVKLLNITTGDLITNLQPHVIGIKQPILLEMYLE